MNSKLLPYINKKRQEGLKDADIRDSLKSVGWSEADLNSAFTLSDIPLPDGSVVATTTQVTAKDNESHTLWDTFLHVLMFINLCIYATALNMVQHVLIEKLLGSGYQNRFSGAYYLYSDGSNFLLTSAASAIIVSLPLFIVLFMRIHRMTLQDPTLKELKSRKTLIYTTLVVTFVIMLGNVISILYKFLNGEVTFNTFFHFLSPVTICSLIFAYYIKEAKGHLKK